MRFFSRSGSEMSSGKFSRMVSALMTSPLVCKGGDRGAALLDDVGFLDRVFVEDRAPGNFGFGRGHDEFMNLEHYAERALTCMMASVQGSRRLVIKRS